MLEAIMNALKLRPSSATSDSLPEQATVGRQSSAPSIQVNSLSQSNGSGGTITGAAGSGS